MLHRLNVPFLVGRRRRRGKKGLSALGEFVLWGCVVVVCD